MTRSQALEAALDLVKELPRPAVGLQSAALARTAHSPAALQPREVTAQRRLRGVEQRGGAGDAAGRHHGAEDLDVTVLDILSGLNCVLINFNLD